MNVVLQIRNAARFSKPQWPCMYSSTDVLEHVLTCACPADCSHMVLCLAGRVSVVSIASDCASLSRLMLAFLAQVWRGEGRLQLYYHVRGISPHFGMARHNCACGDVAPSGIKPTLHWLYDCLGTSARISPANPVHTEREYSNGIHMQRARTVAR